MVKISKDVLSNLLTVFNQYPKQEVSGLLLGYRYEEEFEILEYTISCHLENNYYHCMLDIDDSIKSFLKKRKTFLPYLDVIGSWHSHVGECCDLSNLDLEAIKDITTETTESLLHILVNKKGTESFVVYRYNQKEFTINEYCIF